MSEDQLLQQLEATSSPLRGGWGGGGMGRRWDREYMCSIEPLEYTVLPNLPDWLIKNATSSLKIGVDLSRKSDASSTTTGSSVSSSSS